VIFQDFPGPGIFKKKIQDFPGGVGTLLKVPLEYLAQPGLTSKKQVTYTETK